MSPVRLLIRYIGNENELRIVKCMISSKSGAKYLYIVETNMIVTTGDPTSPLDYRNIAYRITTHRNSSIVDRSEILKSEDGTKYTVSGLSSEYHTLGECMYAKLFDWCFQNGANILGII